MLWGGERFEGVSSTILVHCYNTIESLIEPLPFWAWEVCQSFVGMPLCTTQNTPRNILFIVSCQT